MANTTVEAKLATRKRGEHPDQFIFEFVDRLPGFGQREEIPNKAERPVQASVSAAPTLRGSEQGAGSFAELQQLDYLVFAFAMLLLGLLLADVVYSAAIAETFLKIDPTKHLLRTLAFAAIGVANVCAAFFLYSRAIGFRSRIHASLSGTRHQYAIILLFVLLAAAQFLLAILLTSTDMISVCVDVLNVVRNQTIKWRS